MIRPNPKPAPRAAKSITRKGTKRTNIARRCDILWSLLVRADHRCARCHKSEDTIRAAGLRLEAAHLVDRGRSHNTRWHPRGGLPMCGPVGFTYPDGTPSCHHWLDKQASELARAEFIVGIIGRATYDELHRLKNEKWDHDYDPIVERLHAAMKARGLRLP